MSEYCQRSDLYSYGLPRGGLANPYRLVSSVSTAGASLTLDQHGLSLNTAVTFRAEAGGELPAPLVAGTTYYAIPIDESSFQVAASEDGASVALTTEGESIALVVPIDYEAAIRWASSLIDDMLPAHPVPLPEPIPEIVKMTTAELAVKKLLEKSPSGGDALSKMVDAAWDRIKRWGRGIAIRGTNAPTVNTNLAATKSGTDSRGWGSGCLP